VYGCAGRLGTAAHRSLSPETIVISLLLTVSILDAHGKVRAGAGRALSLLPVAICHFFTRHGKDKLVEVRTLKVLFAHTEGRTRARVTEVWMFNL
jgi:hypothetical protein